MQRVLAGEHRGFGKQLLRPGQVHDLFRAIHRGPVKLDHAALHQVELVTGFPLGKDGLARTQFHPMPVAGYLIQLRISECCKKRALPDLFDVLLG